MIDDGKQAQATILGTKDVNPARVVPLLEVEGKRGKLAGSASGAGVPDALVVTYPSLKELGLAPKSILLSYGDKTSAAYDVVYHSTPAVAEPGFEISQLVDTVVPAQDSSASVTVVVAFKSKGDGQSAERLADSVRLAFTGGEVREVSGGADLKKGAVAVTDDGSYLIKLHNVAGDKLTVKATGKKGSATTATAVLSFSVKTPK